MDTKRTAAAPSAASLEARLSPGAAAVVVKLADVAGVEVAAGLAAFLLAPAAR